MVQQNVLPAQHSSPCPGPSASGRCRDWRLNNYFLEGQGEVYAFQGVGLAKSNSGSCIWSVEREKHKIRLQCETLNF